MKKVYSESVKIWAKGAGITVTGGSLIFLIFLYLQTIGAIEVLSYSGDMICGASDSPCYAYMSFIAKEDIFIYPTDYDPWGRNSPFEFEPEIKEWKLQRSWGTGWRNLPLDKTCTGTWCGLSNSNDKRIFSVAFRENRTYNLRIVAYKNKPTDTIKWSAFSGQIDPIWLRDPLITANLFQTNITSELGSRINITAETSAGNMVWVDIDHHDYGINYSNGTNQTSFFFNITQFREKQFNNLSTSKNLTYRGLVASNQTIYVTAHQYDFIDSVTLNLTGYEVNNTFPNNVKVFINDTLSNRLVGDLKIGTQTLSTLNDSSSILNITYNTSGTKAVYLRLPKNSTVVDALFNLTGYTRKDRNAGEFFVLIHALSLDVTNFSINDCNATLFEPGIWKVNSTNLSDTYEVARAKVYKTLFYGKIGTDPRILEAEGVTRIDTVDYEDKGKRAHYGRMKVKAGTGSVQRHHYINFTDTTTNANVSQWSNVSNENANGNTIWELPDGTEINRLDGLGTIDEIGLDKRTDEKDNPVAGDQYIIYNNGNTQIVTSLILSYSDATWTLDNPGSTTVTTIDFFDDYNIPKLTIFQPVNVNAEVGVINGTKTLTANHRFNNTRQSTNNFSTRINNYLVSCNEDDDDLCNVPIHLTIGLGNGKLEIRDIKVVYTSLVNPFSLNTDLIQGFLRNSTGTVNVPIIIENSKNGSIIVNDLKWDYAGGNKTYEIVAHDAAYANVDRLNVTFIFSNWDYKFPSKIQYLEFIPRRPTSKNVTPYGQSDSRPMFNVTSYSYSKNYSMWTRINSSESCVNLTISQNNRKQDGVVLNNTWYEFQTNITYLNNTAWWLWADFGCTYTTWRLWLPYFEPVACCEGCEVCSKE